MKESNASASPERTWGELIGPVYRHDTVIGRQGINQEDLIVLTSKSGTRVCPIKQFKNDETGQPSTNSLVGLGWKIEKLSGLSEWSCAGGFFAARQDRTMSFCEKLTDKDKSDKDKMVTIKEMLFDEQQRAIQAGSIEDFNLTVLNLSAEYEIDLAHLISQEHEL